MNKKEKFEWDESKEKLFEEIKQLWIDDLELRISDMHEKFSLETDASDIGSGAVLLKKNKPIAYASRSLKKEEKNTQSQKKNI